MKAKALRPGEYFSVDPPDPESHIRVCLTNNKEKGLRFGWPNNSKYWGYMGEEVEVEVIPKITKEDQ